MNNSNINEKEIIIMTKAKKDILFWLGFILLGALTGSMLMFRDIHQGFGSVTFGVVPNFTLTDQFGNSVSKDDFSNHVWVGSYMSIDCKKDKSCEDLMEITASIHHQIKGDPKIKMVSLLSHADILNNHLIIQSLNVKHEHWKFLNGDSKLIDLLVSKCLQKEVYGRSYDTRLFLVDQNGIIRGYYESDKLEEVKKLVKDIERLV